MTTIEPPSFSSKDEEIKYWKNLAYEYRDECEQVKKESDEYMSESRQLEREYEITIDQNEKRIRELTLANHRIQNEIEAMRVKFEICFKETTNQQIEIDALKSEKQQLQKTIIDLEKVNDDLERSRRIIEESMSSFEEALNKALEKNAILENEIDESEDLKEKFQRLYDETRDLKQELQVREKDRTVPDNERYLNGSVTTPHLDNRLKETETQTTPSKRENYQPPLSPASRVMALNIVSDLIRKVGLARFLCSQCGQLKCTVCRADGGTILNGSSCS